MKYTNEQKRILALCRKYKGVKPVFFDHNLSFNILYKDNYYYFNNKHLKNGKLEEWLKTNCELKQVGRPKGSTKPSRKVKRVLSLTKEADEQLSELAEREKSSRSAVISEIVSEKHKNICKDCYYSGVGIYCVRNSWTEPFKDGGCEHFSKKGGE